ncbi:FKBP-type peptidyl-prolyl cis-trans isomerase [Cellulomonas sp. Root137]|uniref:FKBP-type peptidyl-prolyl cis-trans isomerase n=1 Tax=Cellulomonas sp. Root137 TaxID=1736459 RepID=UPI0006FD235D|nr:FKBP-type peptidyl-prolyl cis-trans isomerase [Cellulomonas sp. Root137]KQY43774.1 peptidylprolyl isomerase [Cellulomonas sp. Root137]
MRRLQGRALVAGLAIALVTLAGCTTPETEPAAVTVSGEPGEAPTITYVTPLQVDETRTEQIWPGTGAELVEGAPVLIDFWLEDATDASLVKESYSSNPTAMLLTEEDLGTDLYETLRGQQVGARLLQVSPGSGSGASDYPTVTVVDVLPTRAEGEPVPPVPNLPVVTLDATGAPSITPTGTEPPTTLVAQPLVRGSGEQVGASDVVTVQYTGFAWTTGEAFDSTWSHGLPVSFSLQDVQAWAEGLVDQPVGSQVMLVVPPTYALGVTDSEELAGQTVAFVVDILATGHPEQAAG